MPGADKSEAEDPHDLDRFVETQEGILARAADVERGRRPS